MSKNQKLPPLDAKKGEKPDKIVRITEQYMFDYIEKLNDIKAVEWFAEICEKHTTKKIKDGIEYTGIKVPEVRKEFVKKYFSYLIEKEDTIPVSLGDKLKALREKAEKNDN